MSKEQAVISFTSPKGGVGRTMTLANFASIYSNGVEWANIEKHNVLLIDLDFNAPGIHYYDFYRDYYRITNIIDTNSNNYIDDILKSKEIGLAFYFNNLSHNEKYLKKCEETISSINCNEKDEAIKLFRDFVFFELFLSDEFNPINHLITLDKQLIYILPAGSPSNPKYNDLFFDFDWLEFVKYNLGDFLIKYLIEFTSSYLQKNNNYKVRVLLDQQAGTSIPASINRSLSDANIYVTGFNKQNKNGLITLLNTYKSTYKPKLPWIVLNQYNVRDACFEINTSIINDQKSPHSIFKEKDYDKRRGFIKDICNVFNDNASGGVSAISVRDRIFVTEFSNDAVQSEYFYPKNSISYRNLIEAIVKVEKELVEEDNSEEINFNSKKDSVSIKIIGENVHLIGEKNKFYGPFYAVLTLLVEYFQCKYSNVTIAGYAASHEQIAELSINGKLKDVKLQQVKISDIVTIYILDDEKGNENISIKEFDYVSFPFYLKNEKVLFNEINCFNVSELPNIQSTDCLTNINESYIKNNIIGWKDYSQVENGAIGVPLFVMPQLLAYLNETVDKDSAFQNSFHEKYLRHFNGFNDPMDLLNYAEITKDNSNLKKILLCSDEEIAKFYELQTISGIFNFEEKVNNITSKEKFFDYFFSKGAARAIQSYVELFRLSEKTTDKSKNERDWDILLDEFFHKKFNSMIFLWADTIPMEYRRDTDFIYQLPPSFHYFEECWMLSAIKKDHKQLTENLSFLLHLMQKETQQKLLDYGGLPVHKGVCSDIDNWSEFPFLPHIWKSYENNKEESEIILKRKSFEGYYMYGKQISNELMKLLNSFESIEVNRFVEVFKERIIDLMMNSGDFELQHHLNLIINKPENAVFKKYFINKNKIDEK